MNKQNILEFINYFLNKINISIKRFPSREQRRLIKYLKINNINTVLDVGANIGQFAKQLFLNGYKGTIISFEPQSQAFKILQKRTNKSTWFAVNSALGESASTAIINNAANSVSSSILPILEQHTQVSKESEYINSEEIQISTVDDYLQQNNIKAENVFLKIDTQGYENKVLNGAIISLQKIKVLQLEMSLVPLYKGELLFDEMKQKIESYGFSLSAVESGLADESTGKLLQMDALFIK